MRAQYQNEVLMQVGEVMERWMAAWNNDDAEAIARTFADNGVLFLGEDRITGEEAIRRAFEGALPQAGTVEASLIDFDVRGEMAFATSRFRYSNNQSASGTALVTGNLVWILVKHDSTWKIRSQMFQQSGL